MPRFFSFFVASIGMAAIAACGAASGNSNAATPLPVTTKIAVVATADPTAANPTPVSTTVIDHYTVRNGDTLSGISLQYNISIDDLMRANGLADPNALQIGQVLNIPVQVSRVAPSDFLLPDSEVVYSPAYASFDVTAVANQYNGYLAGYREKVDGDLLTGPQIIQLVAERFSVGPRVLLALLEFQSGWLTQTALTQNQIDYPMGLSDPVRKGLFFQASWAANHLNEGYYGKISGRLGALKFKDRSRARLAPNVNPGTAAIQTVLSYTASWDDWQKQIGANGFIATYRALFGDPAAYAIDPLVPKDLQQPALRLPWSDGELWYLAGGPHSGWGDLAAWSAVDFAPPDTPGSCYPSRLWAVAAAPGKVLRAEHGRVMISLSGSDFQGSGWTLLYMHMATNGRVAVGTPVNTGDRIGHPSCEGGDAEASHVHFARLYNGQWIGADDVPMILSGWTIAVRDQAYEGTMTRGAETRTACNCRDNPTNGIVADAGK
jgi:LasA protease